VADPPCRGGEAMHDGATTVKRNTVMAALAGLTPGAHLVRLDQVDSIYQRDTFAMEAATGMLRSTNHRSRTVLVFRRP